MGGIFRIFVSCHYFLKNYALYAIYSKIFAIFVSAFVTVLRIHDILVWIRIRIRGSMPLTYGSGSRFGFGSCCFHHWPSWRQQNLTKKKVFGRLLVKVHLHHFSKISQKEVKKNSINQGFSYYFCGMIEGSGSRKSKNMWIRRIRIRIRNRNTD